MLVIFDVEGVLFDAEYLPILAEKLNKEKEIWARNIPASDAVDKLIELIKADGNWLDRKKI